MQNIEDLYNIAIRYDELSKTKISSIIRFLEKTYKLNWWATNRKYNFWIYIDSFEFIVIEKSNTFGDEITLCNDRYFKNNNKKIISIDQFMIECDIFDNSYLEAIRELNYEF